MADIKTELYAALGRRKLGTPIYTTVDLPKAKPTDQMRFSCELKVAGIDYVGLGVSSSKKAAMSAAAKSFGIWMLSQQKLSAADLPQLAATDPELANPDPNLWGAAIPRNFGDAVPAPPSAKKKKKNAMPNVVEPVEVKTEAVPMEAISDAPKDQWTMDNAKKGLNEFCQKARLPLPTYKVRQHSNEAHAMNFTAEASVYIQGLDQTIMATGTGTNKKMAETQCALFLVRQLTAVEAMPETALPNAPKKPTEPAPITVALDTSIIERIRDHLKATDSIHVLDTLEASPEDPVSLLVRPEEREVKPQTSSSDDVVAWCPPITNFDPWRQAEITEGPFFDLPLSQVNADFAESTLAEPDSITEARKAHLVYPFRGEILETIKQYQVTLVKGPTDTKKSSQIAQYILDNAISRGVGAECNVIQSVSRQVSATALAAKVAEERGEALGQSVGYGVRFEDVYPRPFGSIMFTASRKMIQRMQNGLQGISHLIVDDIHERELYTDFVLLLVRDMARTYPNLKIILLSAVVDTECFNEYFEDVGLGIVDIEQPLANVDYFFIEDVVTFLNYTPSAEVITKMSKKRKHNTSEIDVTGEEVDEDSGSLAIGESTFINIQGYSEPTKAALASMDEGAIPFELIEHLLVDIHKQGTEGTVLVFLPGDIVVRGLRKRLKTHQVLGNPANCQILAFYDKSTDAEQKLLGQPPSAGIRRIVLSTNICETAFSISDVAYVVDSCRTREVSYNRNSIEWASKASIAHRRRCIRADGEKGFVFHLCTRKRYELLDETSIPEMLKVSMFELTLAAKGLRLGNVHSLIEKALSPPPVDAIVTSEIALKKLGALTDAFELTHLGKLLSTLPVAPSLGKAIILGIVLGIGDVACTFAATTSFELPWIQMDRRHKRLAHRHRSFNGKHFSDHLGLVCVNQRYREQYRHSERTAAGYATENGLDFDVLTSVMKASKYLIDNLIANGFPESAFADAIIDPNFNDDRVGLFLSIVTSAFDGNFAYVMNRRLVVTADKTRALISKDSCLLPVERAQTYEFDSPLVVFTEQVYTHTAIINQVSEVNPLQVLLFGAKRVDATGLKSVKLDNAFTIEIPVHVASLIAALRPCLDTVIATVCESPEAVLSEPDHNGLELTNLVKILSQPDVWKPRSDPPSGLPQPIPTLGRQNGRGHRGRGHRGRGRGRGGPPRPYGQPVPHQIPGYGSSAYPPPPPPPVMYGGAPIQAYDYSMDYYG
uniref:RNA helicase n=1 Tax=Panagrellus redivivus TaxID=6233 RepID=A0A7E4VNZ7_PANRE